MKTTIFTVTHLEFVSLLPFAEVAARFERQLGRFDYGVYRALASQELNAPAIRSSIELMAGPTGLMLFEKQNHGDLLAILGARRKAIQYVVGNPLIAVEMTRHDLGASLYAPLRVLISEHVNGQTRLEYDLPSSLFGRLNNERVDAVARTLDAKLAELAKVATQ